MWRKSSSSVQHKASAVLNCMDKLRSSISNVFRINATPSEDAPPEIEHILEYRPDCANPKVHFVVGMLHLYPSCSAFHGICCSQDVLCIYFTMDCSTKLIPTFALTPENAAGTELKSAFKALKSSFNISICD
jgi:hypothetical protein